MEAFFAYGKTISKAFLWLIKFDEGRRRMKKRKEKGEGDITFTRGGWRMRGHKEGRAATGGKGVAKGGVSSRWVCC